MKAEISPETPELPKPDIERVEGTFKELLSALRPRWRADPHLRDTPKRLARMYVDELFAYFHTPEVDMKTFPRDDETSLSAKERFSMKEIPYRSLCPHHFMPVEWEVDVEWKFKSGINSRNSSVPLIGLSKIPRAVQHLAKQPITQEQFTRLVAEKLHETLTSGGGGAMSLQVNVCVKAKHLCMSHRGILHNPLTETRITLPV